MALMWHVRVAHASVDACKVLHVVALLLLLRYVVPREWQGRI